MAGVNSDNGSCAQLLFHARLKQHGIEPLFVSDGALSFDVGAWNTPTQKFYRVQVKSSKVRHSKNFWKVFTRKRDRSSYSRRDTDIMAIYVAAEDTFFIMPVEAVQGRTHLLIPTTGSGKETALDKYRENWDLFKLP